MATTSSAAQSATQEPGRADAPAFYLAIILEDALANGHEAAYETIRDLLKNEALDKAWTPALFMRCGGDALASDLVARVAEALDMTPADAETLKTQFAQTYPANVLAKAPEKIPSAMMHWFDEAKKRKGALLALSLLPDDAATSIFSKAGLEQIGFSREALPNNADMPLSKRLVRLARALKVVPSKIVLIASGAVAARAALEAGFQCVGVPNELTAHADYTGCQVVLEQLSDMSATELFDALFPMAVPADKRPN